MIKLLLLTITALSLFSCHKYTINEEVVFISFEDSLFKTKLIDADGDNTIDTNSDNEISTAEAESFTGLIDCSVSNIRSLKGIEHFTNLTELWCDGNMLTTMDLSRNKKLKRLDCFNNNLTSLNISGCTALSSLACYDNELKTLISSNKNLKELWCYNNQIENLYLDQNISLTTLNCSYNQLSTLDIRNNKILLTLLCNDNKLTSLDLSKNTRLTFLECYNNLLSSINISKTSIGTNGVLACSPMNNAKQTNILTTMTIKNGWIIRGIYPSRDIEFIPSGTTIQFAK